MPDGADRPVPRGAIEICPQLSWHLPPRAILPDPQEEILHHLLRVFLRLQQSVHICAQGIRIRAEYRVERRVIARARASNPIAFIGSVDLEAEGGSYASHVTSLLPFCFLRNNQSFARTGSLLLMKTLLRAIAVVTALTPSILRGQSTSSGVVSGRVLDRSSATPLSFALVDVVGTLLSTHADSTGAYRIANVPPGTYRVRARRLGYRPAITDSVRVIAHDTTGLTFVMIGLRVSENAGDVMLPKAATAPKLRTLGKP